MAMVDDHALDVDLDSSITGGIRGTKMRVISRRCIWAMVESSLMVRLVLGRWRAGRLAMVDDGFSAERVMGIDFNFGGR